MANSKSWEKICEDHDITKHDFNISPFVITAKQIKRSCQDFKETNEKEVRILCKQDEREKRPQFFKDKNLFLLPVKNGIYNIIKGEGYVDIPPITTEVISYESKLDFTLESSKVGNSEMQHLDFAYASSLIRTFLNDSTLVLTIRGRKYTPKFYFFVNEQKIRVEAVQTEVDAGYEGQNRIVLVEAKNRQITNTIIRQLYYPFRQWSEATKKQITLLFFEKQGRVYNIWQYEFADIFKYNSIRLVKSAKYQVNEKH